MDFIGAYSWPNIRYLLEGFMVTLQVAGLSILFSFVLGLLMGIVRYTRLPIIAQFTGFVVDILRNLPLLFIIFFIGMVLPQTGINISIFWAAVAALSLFEGAMIAEVIRSGLISVDKGQIEAARSSGLSYVQTLRHVILPIALRRMSPPMVSQFISLLKDTSLAVSISLPELMHHIQILSGSNFNYVIPALLLASILYFTINYLLSIVAKRLEARQT
ncbi:amino acid ABC transporter permease [Paenibacillus sp. GCM10028914]|uniref:amino acid ABC transporter permease n=1 Tax=Paenibacillus sp. GCM10028914 TaxID=3273416 RepID=UPI00360F85F8